MGKDVVVYVVTLRKHKDGSIYRRCTFLNKYDANIFFEKYVGNAKYYPSNVQVIKYNPLEV